MLGFFYFWDMDNNNEIIISQGNRPVWQLALAVILYTLGILGLIKYFSLVSPNIDPKYAKGLAGLLYLCAICFVLAIKLSSVKTVFINLAKQKLKINYSVGAIGINYHSKIPDLQYVSVFRNGQEESFEVNLWHTGNKYFKIANFNDLDSAMNFGSIFSKKLNLDLLDTTEKGNPKWIDLNESES